jgi:hypothetical protein
LPNIIDEISPVYVGEKRIILALAEDSLSPRAFSPINITANYDACDPEGIVPPLELTIVAPSEVDFRRVRFNRTAPSTISFQPREGGRHIVRIGEVGHNRWFGFIEITVAGESATSDPVT